MQNIFDRAYAEKRDNEDPLAPFRRRFFHGDEKMIYLDGNSLGRMPLEAPERLQKTAGKEWAERLIRGWNEGWIDLPQRTAAKIARLIGAKENEVLVADSTSVNLYKLIVAGLSLQMGRHKIVSDTLNFPSDLYVLQGAAETLNAGHTIHLVESQDGLAVDSCAVTEALDEDTAILTLSHVTFKSAFRHDMQKLTEAAHQKGVLVLWDLSHSAGAVPVDLNGCNADMAVGCTYKYLNGGPGSPAFLYVRQDLQEKMQSPIRGWFGDARPFAFERDYKPAAGIDRFAAGTPGILSLCTVETAVDIMLEAGMKNIWRKAKLQMEYARALCEEWLTKEGFEIATAVDQHGSHLALRHKEGYRINKAMIDGLGGEYRIIPDFREPDIIRLGIAPLYTRFSDIYLAITQITIVTKKLYEQIDGRRDTVT